MERDADADLTIRYSRIYTVSRGHPWALAMGVKAGRIAAAGDNAGVSRGLEEALALPMMLEIDTIYSAARMLGLGKVTGSLEVGTPTDLIVLDRNLFETADEIADTKVTTAFVEGRVVCERG